MICLLFIVVRLLGNCCWTFGQDFQDSNKWLTLTGPDNENMLVCSLQNPLSLDTHIWWYVNGQLLTSIFLPKGHLQQYESMQDLIDLLGNYPQTIECVINDQVINRLPGVSNKLLFV